LGRKKPERTYPKEIQKKVGIGAVFIGDPEVIILEMKPFAMFKTHYPN